MARTAARTATAPSTAAIAMSLERFRAVSGLAVDHQVSSPANMPIAPLLAQAREHASQRSHRGFLAQWDATFSAKPLDDAADLA